MIDRGTRIRVIERRHRAYDSHGLVISGLQSGYDGTIWLYEVLVDGDDASWRLWDDEIVPLSAIEQLGDVISSESGCHGARRGSV